MKFVPLDVVKKAIEVFENRRIAEQAFDSACAKTSITEINTVDKKAFEEIAPFAIRYKRAEWELDEFLKHLSDHEVCCLAGLFHLGRDVDEGYEIVCRDSIKEAIEYNKNDPYLREYIGGKVYFGETVRSILPQYAKVLANVGED